MVDEKKMGFLNEDNSDMLYGRMVVWSALVRSHRFQRPEFACSGKQHVFRKIVSVDTTESRLDSSRCWKQRKEMALKRSNEYSQIRREDYEKNMSAPEENHPVNGFPIADAATMASRRLVKPNFTQQPKKKPKKKEVEYYRNRVAALNKSFVEWAEKNDDDLALGARDYVYYAKELEAKYFPKETKVATFGSGDCGQLGHGVASDRDTIVSTPRILATFLTRGVQIAQIACGGLHNVACTFQGAVYTWGCNDDGSLGRTGDESVLIMPERVALFDEKIAAVAAGDTQTFAVTRSGDVYGWGCYKDKEGKQWFDCNEVLPPKRKQTTPLLIEGLRKVRTLQCGASSNIALRTDGIVMTWGIGQVGELARPVRPMQIDKEYDLEAIRRDYLAPRSIGTEYKCIGAGAYHILVGTSTSVRGAGLNNYGQLGNGTTSVTEDDLRGSTVVVRGLPANIVSLDAGMHHSLALTSDGALYAWGRADYGQLGLGPDVAKQAGGSVSSPTKVTVPSVSTMAAGSNHNLVVTSSDAVYAWGYGDTNALGLKSSTDDMVVPTKLTALPQDASSVAQVAAGGQHSAMVLI